MTTVLRNGSYAILLLEQNFLACKHSMIVNTLRAWALDTLLARLQFGTAGARDRSDPGPDQTTPMYAT
ncbi:MAG: hypothetical protein ACRDTF_19565 [Pseudonocardiaceae bacterium]